MGALGGYAEPSLSLWYISDDVERITCSVRSLLYLLNTQVNHVPHNHALLHLNVDRRGQTLGCLRGQPWTWNDVALDLREYLCRDVLNARAKRARG